MANSLIQTGVSADDAVSCGGLVARRLADDLSWGEGAICPPANQTTAALQALLEVVLESIEPIAESEVNYSSCTDGRRPIRLQSGESVPVRAQLVGADIVSAFYVAECLGARFYRDIDAPVAERIGDVAAFLTEHGWRPSSHVGCGAAAGFGAIVQNVARFSQDQRYLNRVQALLPPGIFSDEALEKIIATNRARFAAGAYEGLAADSFLRAVEKTSGLRAIAELRDDGRGVHGHVEEAIMRVRLPGMAINEAVVAARSGDREVFGVSDDRMEQLGRLFGRGNDHDYRVAAIALEAFASSGHGTLAKNLPTYLVTVA